MPPYVNGSRTAPVVETPAPPPVVATAADQQGPSGPPFTRRRRRRPGPRAVVLGVVGGAALFIALVVWLAFLGSAGYGERTRGGETHFRYPETDGDWNR